MGALLSVPVSAALLESGRDADEALSACTCARIAVVLDRDDGFHFVAFSPF